MKRVKILSVFLIAVLMLSGCSARQNAEQDFENIMNAFKTADKTKINRYYDMAKVSEFLDADFSAELLNTLKKMDYRIISAEEQDDKNVKINVEITTVDFSKIVSSFLIEVEKLINSESYKVKIPYMIDEEYQELMHELMLKAMNECDEKATDTTEVLMVKTEDGTYKIGGNSNEFLGTLFKNLSETVQSFT